MFQIKEEKQKQFKRGYPLEDSNCFQLYSYQFEQLDVLRLKIEWGAYSVSLSELPNEDRHLDDWDLF